MLTNIHCVLLSLISGSHARLFLLVAVSLLLCLLSLKGDLMSITLEYLLPGGARVLYLPLQGTRLNRWLAHQLSLYLFSSQWNRLPEPRKLFTKKAHGLMVVRAICNSRSTNAYRSLLRRPDLCDKWLPLRPALTHLIDRRLALDLSLGFLLFGCNIQIVLTLIVVIRPRTTVALNKSILDG